LKLIPKNIHISWKSKDILSSNHIFPQQCIQSLVKLAPNWTVTVNIDTDVDEYLKDNLDKSDYILLKDKHIVEKTDVWRLIKLHNEGGLYVDIDRLCNMSLNDIILDETMCLLPTCQDDNFSQDFMCSAPGNPIYSNTLELNLKRRKEGHNNIYFLGPQTYMHGVTLALLGEIVDVNPGAETFNQIRNELDKIPFIKTYRETSPYDTMIYQSEATPFDHEEQKRDFYAKSNLKHWTGDW
jgi:mannosyltransferase OCH1-like enzyme